MLPRTARLRSNRDIRRVYASRNSVASEFLIVRWRPSSLQGVRIAFSVGKKVGGAVVRNRVRRRLREACRGLLPRIRGGFDIVIVARGAAAVMRTGAMQQELFQLLLGSRLLLNDACTPETAGCVVS